MDQSQDDLSPSNVFGVQKPRTSQEEAWHREMERRSYDIIRVSNPGDKDFFVEWDHRHQRVPAKGTADMARFWATKYCKDKAVAMINEMADKLHTEDLEKREKKGLPRFKDKNEENAETYQTARYPKTGDRELLTKIYADLWVGLVYEYGKDEPAVADQDPRSGEVDFTPLEQKILRGLEDRRVDLTAEEKPEVQPIVKDEQPIVQQEEPKVAQEVKTDKKAVLEEVVDEKSEGIA